MKDIRTILAYPILLLGIIFMKLGEVVKGEKYTYRASEVLDIFKSVAKCSECGHEGVLHNHKK